MDAITENLGLIGSGLLTTLVLTLVGYAGALLAGTLMAIFRVSPVPPLRLLATAWVTVACNVPLLCFMILLAFGVPRIGFPVSLRGAAIIAIVFSASGFVCETVRSGVNSVPRGQIEAARALGMPFGLIVRKVVLPQALRRTIQPLVNIFISCLIGSSLAAAIGVPELTNVTQQLNLRYAEAVITFLASGLTYLVIAFLGTRVGVLLERRAEVGAGSTSEVRA